ncbi:MAG: TetR/AcrR family transcriptional regulator [Pseudomonadales bacterium]|nr:TetR/AcrR family transcriptional regulator [Pseudomonadales bacterium]
MSKSTNTSKAQPIDKSSTTGKKYHHGDLRSSLIQEAKVLLAADGVEGLSLRKLADRAGVSRTAPYHHFKDKHALLCALAAEGFEKLNSFVNTELAHNDPKVALPRLVRTYLEFAYKEQEQYDLMFGRRLWKLAQPTEELRNIAYACFRNYAKRITGFLTGTPDKEALRLAQASWGTLHGLSHLLIDGIYIDLAGMEEVSEIAVGIMLKSLQGKG